MRACLTTLAFLLTSFGQIVYASDTKEQALTDAEIEAMLEEIPDLNMLVAVLDAGSKRVSQSLKNAEKAEDNCDIVQNGYVTIFKEATGKNKTQTPQPKEDVDAEIRAALIEVLRTEGKRKSD